MHRSLLSGKIGGVSPGRRNSPSLHELFIDLCAAVQHAHINGRIHPLTATLTNNLAITSKNQGGVDETGAHYEESLDIYRTVYGGSHPY